MKANELMIGDWLQHISGKYFQITRLDMWGDGSVHFACGHPHLWEYNNKFIPIPLTAEILEKNGFMPISKDKYVYAQVTVDLDESLVIIKSKDARMTINIAYVHQLQHAMRLCLIEKEIEIWHDKKN